MIDNRNGPSGPNPFILAVLVVSCSLAAGGTLDAEATTGSVRSSGLDGYAPSVICDAQGLVPLAGCETWARTYGTPTDPVLGPEADEIQDTVGVFEAGSLVVTSGFVKLPTEDHPDAAEHGLVVTYDQQTGDLVWARNLTTTGRGDVRLVELEIDEDRGLVYVAGHATPDAGPYEDAYVAALDLSSGETVWTRTFAGAAGDWDIVLGLALSPRGEHLVGSGWFKPKGGGEHVLAFSLQPETGSVEWSTTSGDLTYAKGYAAPIAFSPDGGTVYFGKTFSSSAVDARDLMTGQLLWSQGAGGAFNLVASPDGQRIFLNRGYETAAMGATDGRTLWSVSKPGNDLAVSEDGKRLFATDGAPLSPVRVSSSGRVSEVASAYALDAASGTLLWQNEGATSWYVGDTVTYSEACKRLYISGSTKGTTARDMFLRVLDPGTGEVEWSARYTHPGAYGEAALSMAIDSEGAAFLGGWAAYDTKESLDYLTVRFDPPGCGAPG